MATTSDERGPELPPRYLGLIPQSTKGRVLLLFAVTNLLLIFLAVWDIAGNGNRMVVGLLPLTILWVFLACALNNVLALVVYITMFRPWAESVDRSGGAAS